MMTARTPTFGALLVVGYTLAVTISDAFTKHLAVQFDAPQVLVICSATILAIILMSNVVTQKKVALKTAHPHAMAIRAGMTVIAAILFYYAFAWLPFADVFLFIALVPILAGLLSAPILNEPVAPVTWIAVMCGSFGVYLVFPGGVADLNAGHVVAFGASVSGTLAIVMGRWIARREQNPLALVFYPQLAILISMLGVAPFVWQPISGAQLLYAMGCGAMLFIARYMLAVAMQALPAYAATSLMNLQFVWMIAVGYVVFQEAPAANMIVGASVIVMAGLFLVVDQHRAMERFSAASRPVLNRARA